MIGQSRHGIPVMDATSGDPGGSRTPNPQIRSLMLYPVELRGRSIQTNVLSRAEKRKQTTPCSLYR